MSKIAVTTAALLTSLLALSQVSENRTVSNFSKLKASQSIQVFYTVSNTVSVKVETDDNEKLQFVKTEVENGTLKVFVDTSSDTGKNSKKKRRNYNNGVNFKTLKAYVSGPSLNSFKASSSADIKIENLNTTENLDVAVSSSGSISGKFKCESAKIDASSSADFKGEIEAKSINVETSSSADVYLKGKTEKLTVKSSSSSKCDAYQLEAGDVFATASSSADINLHVLRSLDAKASSSADINYTGNPSQVTSDKSSSGSVSKR